MDRSVRRASRAMRQREPRQGSSLPAGGASRWRNAARWYGFPAVLSAVVSFAPAATQAAEVNAADCAATAEIVRLAADARRGGRTMPAATAFLKSDAVDIAGKYDPAIPALVAPSILRSATCATPHLAPSNSSLAAPGGPAQSRCCTGAFKTSPPATSISKTCLMRPPSQSNSNHPPYATSAASSSTSPVPPRPPSSGFSPHSSQQIGSTSSSD